MSTIVTRSGKGSPLTHTEVDANFTNLNTDKYQEGSAIGAVTPAAGTFTTLTATGASSLGGAVDAESLKVDATAGSAGSNNYISVSGSTGSGTPIIGAWGTGTTVGMTFRTRGASNYNFATASTAANVQFRIANTSSAVNYVQVTGAATTASPVISAQGSDTNVSLSFNQKGSGNLNFQTSGVTRHRVNGADGSVDSGLSSSGGISLKSLPVSNQVNYLQAAGNATGLAVQFSAQGSDTNISQVFQSKGTGAIDLAAGSSGVNISNGGTVTAITRTAIGSGYTSMPTVAISAPTTAGGVQAVADVRMFAATAAVASGGTGYTIGDVLAVVGTLAGNQVQLTVSTVSAGVITGVTISTVGYTNTIPTNPASVTGGTGTGATFNLTYGLSGFAPMTNAGSGYVEQPTVTFSGGGGSGAAAFARVGGVVTVNSLGSTLNLGTEAGTGFRVLTAGTTATDMWQAISNGTTAILRSSNATSNAQVHTGGTGSLQLGTNGGFTQLSVSHTASAVNYVQVTGAATGSNPTISAQGSDTNAGLTFQSKGTFGITFRNSSNGTIASITHGGSSTPNYVQLAATVSGSSPSVNAAGGDTNIDITLTPKGTGATVANGNFKMNSGYGSAAIAYGCRAWVNFNGTGTVAIRGSGNVTSITDVGTGNYNVNFTEAMPDTNCSVVASVVNNSPAWVSQARTQQPSTSSANIYCSYPNSPYDDSNINVAVFR